MSEHRSRITTHILDATLGRPAGGVEARLEHLTGDDWQLVVSGDTAADGRIPDFGPADLAAGTYRITFDTASYFAATDQVGFYPEVSITFTLADPDAHYHVPLLLSPYAFSTYRGS